MANFAPQGDSVDEADRMFDFYIAASAYPSSAQSPTGSTAVKDESGTPTSLLSATQGFPAPSHEYGAYKQQTGIVPGALDTTLAMNQSNQSLLSYLDFNSGLDFTETDDPFNFNTSPSHDVSSQGLMSIPESMPLLMGTPAPDAFHPTVDPSYITSQEPGALNITPPLSTHSSPVGRLRPGMHQQAALARAQEKVLQQQRAQARKQAHVQHKAHVQHQAHTQQQQQTPLIQPSSTTDQKINAVLGALHCEEDKIEELKSHPVLHPPTRPKKNFDEMDDDEKLLNSDAGKAMSGPAKRQIRNKVSARNFRNRRKAYIENLETEVVSMTNENALLRAKTSALSEENRRLTDLTRMLLSSPAFSQMLTDLSSQPQQFFATAQQSQQQQQQQQQQMQQPQQQAACGYVANAQMGGAPHPFAGAQYMGGLGARPAEAS